MRDHHSDIATVLEQQARMIRRLQRAQRWYGAAVIAIVCLAALGFTSQEAASTPDVVTAHRFALLDANGQECGTWSSYQKEDQQLGNAYLNFRSDEGVRVLLDSGSGNPFLQMNGGGVLLKDGRLCHVKIGADAKFGPHVFLWGQNTDSYGTPNTNRQVELRAPWEDNSHCVVLKSGEETKWSVP